MKIAQFLMKAQKLTARNTLNFRTSCIQIVPKLALNLKDKKRA